MSEDDLSTRSRLLDAAVKLLLTTPPRELTTRKIATEAGVNVAAINYHFRSKDELIDRAMEAATATAFERGVSVLLGDRGTPAERLRDFLVGYASGLVKFPSLTRAAFLGLFQREDNRTFYGGYLREMLDKVAQVITEVRGRNDPPASVARALMVISCVMLPFLVPDTAREAGAVDYSDETARRRYIETALAMLVGAGS
jgi:TetR/AcrR family transcriptional regulator, regulator of cefoperazone and chloramphenicol sensitivity